jgi:uncharacterized protein (TIGR00369 family)
MNQNPSDDPALQRVWDSFARQTVMTTIGAKLERVAHGAVTITLPYREDLTQQHGFLHAGILTIIVDSACGYAALSLMPAEVGVLTIEYKVNFLSPAKGTHFVAHGRVLKPGRNVMVCSGDVVVLQDTQERLIATMLTTMMVVRQSSIVD